MINDYFKRCGFVGIAHGLHNTTAKLQTFFSAKDNYFCIEEVHLTDTQSIAYAC